MTSCHEFPSGIGEPEKMAITLEQKTSLEALELRVRAILPEKYEDCFEDVKPVSMGSAGLKYNAEGKVAWDRMWGSFCDLALAGGPPHKGTLLEPASQAEIDAQPERYEEVVQEICRGVQLVTDLFAEPSPVAGWIRLNCVNQGTAEWLLRAITMENVSVRCEGLELDLPAGPAYRIEKEIKNVITAAAKTTHYWFGHVSQAKRLHIRSLFAMMEEESPLLRPTAGEAVQFESYRAVWDKIAEAIRESMGLRVEDHRYFGWLGIEYPNVRSAVWMMRALVASNVLSRREGAVVFVPVDILRDASGEKVIKTLVQVNGLAGVAGVY